MSFTPLLPASYYKEGFVVKEGVVNQNWRKRWIVFEGSDIAYYKRRNKREKQGSISLLDVTQVYILGEPYKARDNIFALATKRERTYYLQAESQAEARAWVDAIIDVQSFWKAQPQQFFIDFALQVPDELAYDLGEPLEQPAPTTSSNTVQRSTIQPANGIADPMPKVDPLLAYGTIPRRGIQRKATQRSGLDSGMGETFTAGGKAPRSTVFEVFRGADESPSEKRQTVGGTAGGISTGATKSSGTQTKTRARGISKDDLHVDAIVRRTKQNTQGMQTGSVGTMTAHHYNSSAPTTTIMKRRGSAPEAGDRSSDNNYDHYPNNNENDDDDDDDDEDYYFYFGKNFAFKNIQKSDSNPSTPKITPKTNPSVMSATLPTTVGTTNKIEKLKPSTTNTNYNNNSTSNSNNSNNSNSSSPSNNNNTINNTSTSGHVKSNSMTMVSGSLREKPRVNRAPLSRNNTDGATTFAPVNNGISNQSNTNNTNTNIGRASKEVTPPPNTTKTTNTNTNTTVFTDDSINDLNLRSRSSGTLRTTVAGTSSTSTSSSTRAFVDMQKVMRDPRKGVKLENYSFKDCVLGSVILQWLQERTSWPTQKCLEACHLMFTKGYIRPALSGMRKFHDVGLYHIGGTTDASTTTAPSDAVSDSQMKDSTEPQSGTSSGMTLSQRPPRPTGPPPPSTLTINLPPTPITSFSSAFTNTSQSPLITSNTTTYSTTTTSKVILPQEPSKTPRDTTSASTAGLVTLNVGGVMFTTTVKTLTKYPNTFFTNMLANSPNEPGVFFIDRNSRIFEDILDFLRTGHIFIPEDKRERVKLVLEAEFYQIFEVVNRCRAYSPSTD